MSRMYNGAAAINPSHIPLYRGGGGGQVLSFSSNPPTGKAAELFIQKRFCRGHVNASDGRIFWCYEREARVDGSKNVRERWVTPDRYADLVERKRKSDAAHTKSQAYKARAAKRAQTSKRWKQSERGQESAKLSRQKPENRERQRAYSKEYTQRPQVKERNRVAALDRYYRLKQSQEWVAKARERARKWQEKNKEKSKELQRKWRERNPQRANQYVKTRYAEDPQFALACRVRARVYQAAKKGGVSKTGRTEELIGCSFDFLRQHIERQFKGGMSWGNAGSFHIDHIIPLAAFDLTDQMQLKVACNWQNMRPLPPSENMRKGAKILNGQQPLPLSVHSETFNTQAA